MFDLIGNIIMDGIILIIWMAITLFPICSEDEFKNHPLWGIIALVIFYGFPVLCILDDSVFKPLGIIMIIIDVLVIIFTYNESPAYKSIIFIFESSAFLLRLSAILILGCLGYQMISWIPQTSLSLSNFYKDNIILPVKTEVQELIEESKKTFTISASETSITLNLDEEESKNITLTIGNGVYYKKSSIDNLSVSVTKPSDLISGDFVDDDRSDNQITYQIIPKASGSGEIIIKLYESNDADTVYDEITLKFTVTKTPDHGIFADHSYQVFDTSVSWTEAEAVCEAQGGHLAVIESEEEQNFVQSLIKSTRKENIWIGGIYSLEDNAWLWVTHVPFEYTNWDESQPDNYIGEEYYIRMKNRDETYTDWEAFDGKWNDTGNEADDGVPLSTFGYICEWDYVRTNVIESLEPSVTSNYSHPSEITDCFGNQYTKDEAFLLTAHGSNDNGKVTFDFNEVNYRTLEYDISISESSKKTLTTYYKDISSFTLCDVSLVAVLEDGTEVNCKEASASLEYSFFRHSELIHCTAVLPENTVKIRFKASLSQNLAVEVIIANAVLTTTVKEAT